MFARYFYDLTIDNAQPVNSVTLLADVLHLVLKRVISTQLLINRKGGPFGALFRMQL